LKTKYIPFLDGLRALAVLLVIFNHLNVPFFSGGYIGVDIFFVISGYLITGILAEDYLNFYRGSTESDNLYVNLRVFYFKRARRILPLAIFTLVVSLIFSFFIFAHSRFSQELTSAFWSSIFAANIHLVSLATDYFASNTGEKSVFQHFWSLAVEEQFYLFYPLIFSLALRLHGLRSGKLKLYWYRRVAIVVSVLGILSFSYNLISVSMSPIQAYFSSFSRAWELACGCLLSIVSYSKFKVNSKKILRRLGLIGFLAILFATLLFKHDSTYPGIRALFPVLGTSLIIFSITSLKGEKNLLERFLSAMPVTYLGRISYSLYLVHWPLLVLLESKYPSALNSLAGTMLYLLATFSISIFCYAAIERPTRRIPVPSAYFRNHSPWSTWISRQLRKIDGDIWFIGIVSILIISIIGTVQNYSPKAPSKYNFQPYVYPSNSQPVDNNLSPQNTFDSKTASSSEAPSTETLNGLITKWQTDLSNQGTNLVLNDKTTPSLKQLNSPGGNSVRWGYISIGSSCGQEKPIGGISDFSCDYRNGNDGKQVKVLLIGDSHAQQLVPTIIEAFRNTNLQFSLYGRSGCPIGGISLTNNPESNKACLALWQTKLKVKLANLQFDYVIASDWGASEDYGNNLVAKLEGLKFLKTIGTKLVLFAPTPRYPIFSSCFKNPSDVSACSGKRYQALDSRYQAFASQSGASFFPISDLLCTGNICPALIHNNFVNRGDGSHLTEATARDLANPLRALLSLP
jgi:peptidoglycan/LPS O-acetylase OafA/YrhL